MSEPEQGEGASRWASRGETVAPPRRLDLRPLSMAVVALVAIWLYRRAFTFAFFNDDPSGHFAWMEGRTVIEFFTNSAAYGYYRPIVFTVLRLLERLAGSGAFPHSPVADHALLILLHGANTALVWALGHRLTGRAAFAWAAALVFAAMPFSYEAIAYVASLTHPLLLFWLLLAALSFERGLAAAGRAHEMGRRSKPVGYRALALLWLTLGLLTHENGLFGLPALAGIDWLRRPADSARGRLRRLWPFAVPAALYGVLWLSVPKNSDQGLNSLPDIGRNALPFAQALVYPLLPLARVDAGELTTLVGLAAVTVIALGLLAWRAGSGRLWVFALGWVGLSALPALLFLQPAYVYGSPRLAYLPAVGVGLLWAVPLAGKRLAWPKLAFGGLAAVYIAAITLPALPFVRCQLDFYAETSRLAREMAGSAAGARANREVVFVNAPFYFSSSAAHPDGCPSPYPLTPTGGILIPPYAQARDFVRFNGGPDRPARGVSFAGYAPGWRTFGPEIDAEALRTAVAVGAVYVFDLASGAFSDLSAIWRPDGATSGRAWASFGGALDLSSAEIGVQGDRLEVRLDWRVTGSAAVMPAVFVHVYDRAGALVAQHDGPPGGAFVPAALWAVGDGISETRRIDLAGLPPGNYSIGAGVYNPADGTRWAAVSGGQTLADDILRLGTLTR